MNSFLYKEIIDDYLFPFIGENFNYRAKLHQDNDSKHSGKLCKTSLKALRIPWVITIQQFFSF
jgi:hypothetical protein